MIFSLWDTAIFLWLNSLAGSSFFFDTLVVFFATHLIHLLTGGIVLAAVFWYVKAPQEWRRILVFLVTVYGSVFLARIVIAEPLRILFDRMRPFEALPSVYQLVDHAAGRSFPSGHASHSFAMAAALVGYHKKAGIAFLGAAFFISLARVVAGIHWPSDILAGAAVGVASAFLIHSISKKWASPVIQL